MIKTKAGHWTLFAAMLLFFAACGKKDDPSPTPVLSAPTAMDKIAAEAEVKASSGPVELTLLLHKTKIKTGESIWQQIRIRNIGEKNIVAADFVFYDPRELRKQSGSRYGIYLEAVGPDGKPLEVKYEEPADQGSDINYGVSGLIEVEGPEEKAMVDGWKRQGLSQIEINTRLIEFNTKKMRAAKKSQQWSGIELLPGQSAETKSAFFFSHKDRMENRPMPRPIGNFSQVDFFEFNAAGIYKIRAVYDRAPTAELNKIRGKFPVAPQEVLVRTPWIQVAVAL